MSLLLLLYMGARNYLYPCSPAAICAAFSVLLSISCLSSILELDGGFYWSYTDMSASVEGGAFLRRLTLMTTLPSSRRRRAPSSAMII